MERRGKENTQEWPMGMNESCEDVSGSCLRINPTESSKRSTNTSHPAAELPALSRLKGNIIKMQMWPIYGGAEAQTGVWCGYKHAIRSMGRETEELWHSGIQAA